MVEPLEREDTLKLFDKKLAQAEDFGGIAELADALGYMPLAIV